jgi:hypothetical protein
MVVAGFPRREGPIRRKLLAAGKSGKPLQDEREARAFEKGYSQTGVIEIDQNMSRVAYVEVKDRLTGGIEPEAVASQAHVERKSAGG